MLDFPTLQLEILSELYGESAAIPILNELRAKVVKYRKKIEEQFHSETKLTERDMMLITYGDQVSEAGKPPLQSLADFCIRNLSGLVNCLHILPFYPYSSDDGFSVKDFRQVNAALGGWDDIARLHEHYRLMFDGVINHVSVQSEWFRAFLHNENNYREYFIVIQGEPDLSKVVRPRTQPLLTRFSEYPNEKSVWTTFSADQVDLNYTNPRVLLEIIDVLLFYVSHGAEFIRLDAIAYLWKEIGTPCIHLPQTHRVIQLFRAILDEVAPDVKLITETNVPHLDNISYFGNGANEAQLVYNFALAPLVLHTIHTGDARALSRWASSLSLPSDQVTFFNFLASHDGIGLNPVRGILNNEAIDALVQRAVAHGGLISYKQNPDGTKSPYELNINYFDALSNPGDVESLDIQVDRFMSAQAIMLSLVGMPGIYFHSLFGSRGWLQGVRQTGHNRTINRQKFSRKELEQALADASNLRYRVFNRFTQLLRARTASQAFDPYGIQKVVECGDAIFALLRLAPKTNERVLCLQNVTTHPQFLSLNFDDIFDLQSERAPIVNLIDGERIEGGSQSTLRLSPYQVCWLNLQKSP